MSQTSRRSVTTLDDESSGEEGRWKRIRRGKEVAKEEEPEEPEDPLIRLAQAYEQVGLAQVELAMARIAMDEYIARKADR